MDRNRLLLFIVLSLAIMIGWTQFVVPLLNPPAAKAPNDRHAQAVDDGDKGAAEPAAVQPAGEDGEEQMAVAAPVPEGAEPPDVKGGEPVAVRPKPKPKLKRHPQRTVLLGSLDAETNYFAAVETTTTGAAVDRFTLNDPRYKELRQVAGAPREQLDVVRPVAAAADGRAFRTLQTAVPQIDAQLEPFDASLRDVDWEVAETVADPSNNNIVSSVTYRYVSPDGKLEVRKKYSLAPVAVIDGNPRETRDTQTAGYELKFDLTVVNRGDEPQQADYVLQGPVGLPLENIEHTSIFRSVQDGHYAEDQEGVPPSERDVKLVTLTAKKVVDQANDDELEPWKNPFRYIGVDVQYFASLLVPQADQLKTPYVSEAQPMLLDEAAKPERSNVSVELTSIPLKLAAADSVTHSYSLFAGPKRDALLEPLGATGIIEYGWFGAVSRVMLAMMKFMHDTLYLPYGIAIICLTIIVRGCMYPISRKQAAGAKKMKELQPKIAELKKKYANEKEKFARAQMELFSKHNYNPLAGCLPIVLQLPIFIGLYQALRNSVDLRLAPFPLTWIDNLAAPDALFVMPFALPFLGHDFNLLPLITVGLFLVQQKLFMPPAADEQQAMQQKMMNYMMIFMGFMFYHVPAGLCVYFIASSLWGIGERKMLDYGKPAADPEKKTDETAAEPAKTWKKPAAQNDDGPARKGFLQKLMEAADAAAQSGQSESQANGRTNPDRRGGGKKRKKTRR